MSRDRATSLDRCQFPSRSARRIETLCSPERSRIACRKVSWSIPANLKLSRALRGEVYSSWSWGLLRDVPGFSGSIIEGKNERIRVGTHPSPVRRRLCRNLIAPRSSIESYSERKLSNVDAPGGGGPFGARGTCSEFAFRIVVSI